MAQLSLVAPYPRVIAYIGSTIAAVVTQVDAKVLLLNQNLITPTIVAGGTTPLAVGLVYNGSIVVSDISVVDTGMQLQYMASVHWIEVTTVPAIS
jgi:hypothetical protein